MHHADGGEATACPAGYRLPVEINHSGRSPSRSAVPARVTKVNKTLICCRGGCDLRKQGGRTMRSGMSLSAGFARVSAAVLAAGNDAVLSVGVALAWSRYRDHVYADSFGNLVIQSPSGYKRIVVGQGHLAKELSSYEGADDFRSGCRLSRRWRQRLRTTIATVTGRPISSRVAATCTACRTASSRKRLASRPPAASLTRIELRTKELHG